MLGEADMTRPQDACAQAVLYHGHTGSKKIEIQPCVTIYILALSFTDLVNINSTKTNIAALLEDKNVSCTLDYSSLVCFILIPYAPLLFTEVI